MENYLSIISNKTEFPFTTCQMYFDYLNLRSLTTKVKDLKEFSKKYGLKVSGTKIILINRLEQYLKLSYFAIKIQRIIKQRFKFRKRMATKIQNAIRNYMFKKMIQLRGPAYFNRKLCNNDHDFLTGDEMENIDSNQFFSFVDQENFIYGFDLISITSLLQKGEQSRKTVLNPYNRQQISDNILWKLKRLLKLCKIYNVKVNVDIPNSFSSNTIQTVRTLESRALELFHTFDSLGNYTNINWFMDLNSIRLLRFMHELFDIWNYRSQTSLQIKREICPPYGDPFRRCTHIVFASPNMYSLETLRTFALQFMESLTYRGINNDSKTLGVYFVLGALTIVHNDAAMSMPWLYQSFI